MSGYDDRGPSLSDALRSLGMTHRAPPAGRQGREIIDVDGVSLGVHTAAEGWALVHAVERDVADRAKRAGR